jgi:1,4-dihydroxy-2-naphthoyl-CoA synthase
MPNRVARKLQNGAGKERLPRLRLLRLVRTSSVAVTKPVIAMRDGPAIQDGQGFEVWSLRELEAENAELRNTAIQLALEIQDLRMAGNRPQVRSVGSC